MNIALGCPPAFVTSRTQCDALVTLGEICRNGAGRPWRARPALPVQARQAENIRFWHGLCGAERAAVIGAQVLLDQLRASSPKLSPAAPPPRARRVRTAPGRHQRRARAPRAVRTVARPLARPGADGWRPHPGRQSGHRLRHRRAGRDIRATRVRARLLSDRCTDGRPLARPAVHPSRSTRWPAAACVPIAVTGVVCEIGGAAGARGRAVPARGGRGRAVPEKTATMPLRQLDGPRAL